MSESNSVASARNSTNCQLTQEVANPGDSEDAVVTGNICLSQK